MRKSVWQNPISMCPKFANPGDIATLVRCDRDGTEVFDCLTGAPIRPRVMAEKVRVSNYRTWSAMTFLRIVIPLPLVGGA
jgi:hypothetical protein